MMVGEADELLFVPFVSTVEEVMSAVLLTAPVAEEATWKTNSNVADAPGAKETSVHVIVAPALQLKVGPLVCMAETKVVFSGTLSVRDTFAAVEGPAFVAVTV